MKHLTLLSILLAIGMLAIAGCTIWKAPATNTNSSTNAPIVNAPLPDDQNMVRITAPKPNSLVSSPVTVTGEARGTWFFEASFPIEITDANGKVIGNGFAQAQGEWMTEDFVPFIATITFDDPTTETGGIILKKDNPSGLPEYDQSLRLPVVFSIDDRTKFSIFLGSSTLDPNIMDCSIVYPVMRSVPKTQGVARAALEQLIAGPTLEERVAGFFTSINTRTIIQKLTIENGIARVDFNDQIEYQVGGSCRVTAIRSQIIQTLKQFPTVKDIIISVNGRTEDILQP